MHHRSCCAPEVGEGRQVSHRSVAGDSAAGAAVPCRASGRAWHRRAGPCLAPLALPHPSAPSRATPKPAATLSRRACVVLEHAVRRPSSHRARPGRPTLELAPHLATPPLCSLATPHVATPLHRPYGERTSPLEPPCSESTVRHRGCINTPPVPELFPTPLHCPSPTPPPLVHRQEGGDAAAKPQLPPSFFELRHCPR